MLGPQLIHDSPLVSYRPSAFVVPRAEPASARIWRCVTSFKLFFHLTETRFRTGYHGFKSLT